MIPTSDRKVWAWWRYDLTKAVAFLKEGGWRLWCRVLVIGPIAFAVIWKERDPNV